jgi:hypothetical protein
VVRRTVKAKPPSELVERVCREVLLTNAADWWKRGQPRVFVRSGDTAKNMNPSVRRELDQLFEVMNAQIDQSTRLWYEEHYQRYGGRLEELPWNKSTRRRRREEAAS